MENLLEQEKQRTLKFVLKDRAGDCHVKQTDGGPDIGLVQAVTVKAQVGHLTTALVETLCTEAEVEVLEKNTELHVTIVEQEAYQKGFDAAHGKDFTNPYGIGSYGDFLYQKGFYQGIKERFEALHGRKIEG